MTRTTDRSLAFRRALARGLWLLNLVIGAMSAVLMSLAGTVVFVPAALAIQTLAVALLAGMLAGRAAARPAGLWLLSGLLQGIIGVALWVSVAAHNDFLQAYPLLFSVLVWLVTSLVAQDQLAPPSSSARA